MSFRPGDRVRHNMSWSLGTVVSLPGAGLIVPKDDGEAYATHPVNWHLAPAEPFDRDTLHAARATWLPSTGALEAADDAVSENVFHGDTRWRLPQS